MTRECREDVGGNKSEVSGVFIGELYLNPEMDFTGGRKGSEEQRLSARTLVENPADKGCNSFRLWSLRCLL